MWVIGHDVPDIRDVYVCVNVVLCTGGRLDQYRYTRAGVAHACTDLLTSFTC